MEPSLTETWRKYSCEEYFNPSALSDHSTSVYKSIEDARKKVASSLEADADEIYFTSGGTEADNLAVSGVTGGKKGNIITSKVEHPAVYNTIKNLKNKGFEIRYVKLDEEGAADVQSLASLIDENTLLVSLMHVNNETGAINDIPAIYKAVKQRAPMAIMHVDGVQGFLKVPFDARYCDMYSISGHKFHAPKGVGALYVKRGTRFAGGQIGGGQERNLRSGTTNTPGIMGMDAAIGYYAENIDNIRQRLMNMKLRLASNLTSISDTFINGPAPELGAPHILNVSFLGVRGEVLLHALEEKGIYVSTGSACSAHKKGKNRILNAMGVVGDRQEGAIRFSLSMFNTIEEMDIAAEEIAAQLAFLRRFKRR